MTEEEVRAEFIALTDKVGVLSAVSMVAEEVGTEIPNSTFYRARNGKCKKTMLYFLNYALKNAIKKKA